VGGCSTPVLEDHGQTRFEREQAGYQDSSDRERENTLRQRETAKFGDDSAAVCFG